GRAVLSFHVTRFASRAVRFLFLGARGFRPARHEDVLSSFHDFNLDLLSGETWRFKQQPTHERECKKRSHVNLPSTAGGHTRSWKNAMLNRATCGVNINVTHRLFTHRLRLATISRDARRRSHPFWPRHPSHTRGAEDQSGRGCGPVRAASDLLQRR